MNYQDMLENAAELEASGDREAAYLVYDQIYEAVIRNAGDHAKDIEGALTEEDGQKTMTQKFFDAVNQYLATEPSLRLALYNLGRLHLLKGEKRRARQLLLRSAELTPNDIDFPELELLLAEVTD